MYYVNEQFVNLTVTLVSDDSMRRCSNDNKYYYVLMYNEGHGGGGQQNYSGHGASSGYGSGGPGEERWRNQGA